MSIFEEKIKKRNTQKNISQQLQPKRQNKIEYNAGAGENWSRGEEDKLLFENNIVCNRFGMLYYQCRG